MSANRARILEAATVASVMTPTRVSVPVESTIAMVERAFVETAARCVIVVNARGAAVGFVTPRELGGPERDLRTPIAEVMLPVVLAVPAETSAVRASALLAHAHVDAIAVLSREGNVIGFVSAEDLPLPQLNEELRAVC